MLRILENFKKKTGGLLDREVIDMDYHSVVVDNVSIKKIKAYSSRYRSSQRFGKGHIFTDDEKREKINKFKAINLP